LNEYWPTQLPSGIIHGDLFPDNVFFQDKKLSGVIDFYFSCYDAWMYDIAIILNAWCFENEREFNITKARMLLEGYNGIRTITDAEWHALPILASGAALRFLLTRAHDWCNPIKGALVKPKDPLEYLHKLRFHHGIQSYKEYGV
jgi:homoserine kinase type II